MTALHAFCQRHGQVIAQIIKTKFAVGSVNDICFIGFSAVHQCKLVQIFTGIGFVQVDQECFLAIFCAVCHLQHTHTQSERIIDGSHPAGITAGQVIIDGHQMNTAPGEGIQIHRQGGDQSFAFTGAHFSNLAVMQGHAADHLDIVMAQSDGALAGFTYRCKGFGSKSSRVSPSSKRSRNSTVFV